MRTTDSRAVVVPQTGNLQIATARKIDYCELIYIIPCGYSAFLGCAR
jgi:hypothetical protein